MTSTSDRYRQAAVAYLIYGIVYLTGAVYLASMDVVARSGWVWFLVGVLFILVLPPLIWYEYKWVTRVLAILIGVRVVGLGRTIVTGTSEPVPMPGGWELPMQYGALVFLVVAALTGFMLARAGWRFGRGEKSTSAGA